MDNLRADFLRLVDDDSAAYGGVAEAMKLPKTNDDEKRERTERIPAALLDACERGIAKSTPATASDIGVGALMAEAALRGASLNVMINLASVKDPAQVKARSEDLDRALDGAEAQRKRITDFVETRIAR